MLQDLRDMLNRLDDVEIEQLCIVYFSTVADKLGRGTGKQEKINLLLDHCRRHPEEGARLRMILQRRRSPNAEAAVLPTDPGGGGNPPQVAGTIPIIPNGGALMDEMLVLAAGLQFAYWLWNATIQPGMTRFSDSIGVTLGEIGSDRLKRWFGSAPTDSQGDVNESQAAQTQKLDTARNTVRNDPEWNTSRFMDTTKRTLVALLRDSTKYGMGELQVFWQQFGDPLIEFNLLVAQSVLVGNVQASIADRLVMEAIRNRKLPELIAAMRRV